MKMVLHFHNLGDGTQSVMTDYPLRSPFSFLEVAEGIPRLEVERQPCVSKDTATKCSVQKIHLGVHATSVQNRALAYCTHKKNL